MGRHVRLFVVLLVASVVASGCGLRPADEERPGEADGEDCPPVERPDPVALEIGVVIESSSGRPLHVLCDVQYPTSPPTGGDHFPSWQNCGFYTEPVRDETAVHALEHGAIWIAYSPDLPAADVDEIAALVATDPHWLASPYPGLQNPIVLSAWDRQVAVDRITDPAVSDFADRQLGRVSQTAPEAGVSCGGQIGAPPGDPDAGYREIFDRIAG